MESRENEIKLKEIEIIRSRLNYLNNIKRPLSGFTETIEFSPEDTVAVLQNEYAITHAEDKTPILGTFGAGPCVIVAIYDAINKIAILAHCDECSNINDLQDIVGYLSLPHTQAHLYGYEVGSLSDSLRNCYEIVKFLETNKIQISNADILRPKGSPDGSLAIDARTGAIISPIKMSDLKITEAESERIANLEFECQKKSIIIHLRLNDLAQREQNLSVEDYLLERDSLVRINMSEVYCAFPEKLLDNATQQNSALQNFSILANNQEKTSENKNDEENKLTNSPDH